MDELVIAAAADDAYAWPAIVALLSAAARSSVPVTCLLVADGIAADKRLALSDALQAWSFPCEIVDANLERFDSLPEGRPYLTRAAYARLLVPALAEPYAARTLYLDCDTLTVDDVAELASWPFQGATVGAVLDGRIGDPYAVQDWQERGFDPLAPYFNSGVLVIDNGRWVRDNVTAETLELLEHHAELIMFEDQGALNTVLYGRWITIPRRWNRMIHRSPSLRVGPWVVSRRERVNLRRVGILHYFEGVKPWHRRYPPGPLLSLYRSAWTRFANAELPPARTYLDWLRDRHALAS